MKKLLLIDGSHLAYRAFYAFSRASLFTSTGENVGAIFGVVGSLLPLVREVSPDYAGFCVDTPAPTQRHLLFAEYKATREEMPDEMRKQLPLVKEAACVLGFSVLEKEGVGVKRGIFGAVMEVELLNAGPVTIILDSEVL